MFRDALDLHTTVVDMWERFSTMMPLWRFVILGVFISEGASLNNENVHGARYECRELRHNMCADHYGLETWYGRFPNAAGLNKDDSVANFFNFFALLYQDNYCSHVLHTLLCTHYFPPCSPDCPDRWVTPSRQLCAEAVEACQPYARILYGREFESDFLNCTSFAEASLVENCLINSESNTTGTCCSASEGEVHLSAQNSNIHIDFCPPVGSRVYQAMENENSLEICVVLANTGSSDSTTTLSQPVSLRLRPKETKMSFLPPANLEDDYSLPNTLLKFPVGSVKGTKSCTEVTIYNDYLREGRETFSIEAVSTASLPVTFGSGRVGSLSVSVEVIIIDDDEPFIPEDECKGKCSIRNRANSNTFSQNSYTYAVHIEALGRRNSNDSSLLDTIIIECWEFGLPHICPKENRTRYSFPVCRECTLDFRGGEEYLIAGRHVRGLGPGKGMYLPNYRKGGLLSMWRRSYNNVGEWVNTANQTVH